MTNQELLASMQQAGRLHIVSVGDVPTSSIVYRLPKKITLKNRRFAMVIGQELHLRKYEDPAHGWLAVPFQWLEQFGIVNQVSCCSYRRGATAYLEEDCDAPLFRKNAEQHGFRLFVDYRHTNDRSSIRSYPSFW